MMQLPYTCWTTPVQRQSSNKVKESRGRHAGKSRRTLAKWRFHRRKGETKRKRARAAEEEDRLPRGGQVDSESGAARDGAPHAAGEADDAAVPVAHAADAVQRAVQAATVVAPKVAHLRRFGSLYFSVEVSCRHRWHVVFHTSTVNSSCRHLGILFSAYLHICKVCRGAHSRRDHGIILSCTTCCVTFSEASLTLRTAIHGSATQSH